MPGKKVYFDFAARNVAVRWGLLKDTDLPRAFILRVTKLITPPVVDENGIKVIIFASMLDANTIEGSTPSIRMMRAPRPVAYLPRRRGFCTLFIVIFVLSSIFISCIVHYYKHLTGKSTNN
ncbi:hypothetical protein KGM_203380 [Danaus plexippus plexippus]|uniref:Uncharacterized protein n=1 Tax=Danaus plexippus plexippus TaxID=278856 RepID=A0A212EQN5_DANPL|nr:hypothetical protein KGM_203380 [Danaus plexippus plexippus]